MQDVISTILTISGTLLVFYMIAKLGAWYEDKNKK